MDEVEGFTKELLKRDPNSFDGHRLIGDLNYSRATDGVSRASTMKTARSCWKPPTEEYRKADSIKPGQQGVSMQLARALAAKARFAERRGVVPQA